MVTHRYATKEEKATKTCKSLLDVALQRAKDKGVDDEDGAVRIFSSYLAVSPDEGKKLARRARLSPWCKCPACRVEVLGFCASGLILRAPTLITVTDNKSTKISGLSVVLRAPSPA